MRRVPSAWTEKPISTDPARLQALHDLVRLATDHFCTGTATLACLHYLPVDELKVDQHFIILMQADEPDHQTVAAVIQLARAANAEAVAEGIDA
jgi:EAL domain-containing protein (putative c-di-GMP-specific phosphodiesterase class I)